MSSIHHHNNRTRHSSTNLDDMELENFQEEPLPQLAFDIGPPGTFVVTTVPSFETSLMPPSFVSAQSDIVMRRQHQRPRGGGGVKFTAIPSRFLNIPSTFEFAGWGTMTKEDLTTECISKGDDDVTNARKSQTLGQFTASALAGNAVLGSVFYALPAVVVVSSIYSPISLFVATLIIFIWRPIMEELASALPIGGAPYTYMLNVSSKFLALVSAALLLLDFASTSVVSAATAISYLAGEVTLPFAVYGGTLLVLAIFTVVSLSGLRESARMALAVLTFHVVTMIVLFIASIIAWSHVGNSQLRANWNAGTISAKPGEVARQIFNGVCIGMLGLTGFECTPSYVSSTKPGRYPLVLRNLHYPAILLNAPSMLFLLALVPLDTILQGANVLSILAEIAAGRWLRIWIVVDAVIVLCGGVLMGILGACELGERLALDRILPQIFLHRLPITHAPAVSIVAFVLFCYIIYATSGASLSIVSKMFSLVWLTVMALFPLAVLLLKFNRGRLPRKPITPLPIVFLALALAFVIFGGNIAIDPSTVGYAAAYFIAITALFYVTMKKGRILRWMFWIYDQSPFLHKFAFTKGWGGKMSNVMRLIRRQPVCLLVKTDEINGLFDRLQYVSENEETSCLKLVHFYEEEGGIPSEMEANWKLIDEAFPEITVDLVLVRGHFNPSNVAALAHRLNIPTTLMFMSCPSSNLPYAAADFNTRIISL